jgi:hypothetical protein
MTIRNRDENGKIVPHEPDEKSRQLVKTCAGLGLPYKMIATLVGIGSDNTLMKYYAAELEEGKAQATFEVAKTLFHRATVGKDLGAAIFWLKAQAGWREKHVLDDPENRQSLADLIALSGLSSTPQALPAPEDDQPPKRH